MATMWFPPANWQQQINTIDSVVLNYTSTYPAVNMTMFCETAKGTGNYIWWNLPAPLPSNSTFVLHLSNYNLQNYINTWPAGCHFQLTNSQNGTRQVNGGFLPVTTAANKPETTWSQSTAGSASSTSYSTIAAPTAVGSGTSTVSTEPSATSTNPASSTNMTSEGLSQSARIGIGVGVGLGAVLIIALAILSILLYRRRRQAQSTELPNTGNGVRYEKAELLGNPLPLPLAPPGELHGSAGGAKVPKTPGVGDYFGGNAQNQWSPPQELFASSTFADDQTHPAHPAQRYELGA